MGEESGTPTKRRSGLSEEAIRMALDSRWEEAVRLNRLVLEEDPEDVDALNRLGKALFELGQYEESLAAYERALNLDPYNRIARKNQARVSDLLASKQAQAKLESSERERIRPDLFISESGKSAVIPLHGVISPAVLRKMSRGDTVRLEASGQSVLVKTGEGALLGRLDPRMGRRLAEFIQIGNRYSAAIAEVGATGAKVFVRETHQHPRLLGRLSFPPVGAAATETVRPYIRDLGLQLQEAFEAALDEEDEEEEGGEEMEEEGMEEEDLGEEIEEEEEDEFEDLDEEVEEV